MKNGFYILIVVVSLVVIVVVGSKLYIDYKNEQKQTELTNNNGIKYIVNQINNVNELYHLKINVDSLSKQAYNADNKTEAIARLVSYRDSLMSANK